ncbi:TorD/DmsD family molecular chaperone [Haladaptatus sp. NG-SE-30]
MDETTSKDDLTPTERHSARAALYSAAAAGFCYPDETAVAELTHEDTAEGLRSAAAKLGFESAVEELLSALESTTYDDLESTYNRLFGLPGEEGTYPVIPYEAEYTVGDEVGRQQRRIATVVGLLETFGVEPSAEFNERQDHVVVELELMQVLAARRAVAHYEGDEETAENVARAESIVLGEHLSGFVPAFAHDLRRIEDEGVYRAVADLAATLVSSDEANHPDPDVDFETSTEVRTRA